VPAGFWDEIAAKLTLRFGNGELTEGIVEAVTAAGHQLKTYFPCADERRERLSDEIDVSD